MREMIELKQQHFAAPNEKMDLSNDHEWPLTSQ